MTELRIAGTVQDSIVDGPGLRFTVFTQGCPHKCEGCHNPNTHDESAGELRPVAEIIEEMRGNPLTDGLTLSGGEPFLQPEGCLALGKAAAESGLTIWIFSGFNYEELVEMGTRDENVAALLDITHVLVDGRFLIGERSLELKWKGSKNQRVIDMVKTREMGSIKELE